MVSLKPRARRGGGVRSFIWQSMVQVEKQAITFRRFWSVTATSCVVCPPSTSSDGACGAAAATTETACSADDASQAEGMMPLDLP